MPAYVAALIKHANEQRNSAQNEGMADASIVLSDKWADKLMSVPFISCKYSFAFQFSACCLFNSPGVIIQFSVKLYYDHGH